MSGQSVRLKSQGGYFYNPRTEMLKFIPRNAVCILDVGCGEGSFLRSLKAEGREIWGVEMNAEAAEKANEVCDFVLTGSFEEVFEQLPVKHFDCIIFNDVLEHMYAPWEVLSQVKSLLSDEGVIVSSIPNFRYISNLILEIVWKGEFRYKPEGGILDDTHIRFFTSKSIVRMYNEQGFEIVMHEGIKPCKSWKEKLFIFLSFGILKDARFKQFATVAKVRK